MPDPNNPWGPRNTGPKRPNELDELIKGIKKLFGGKTKPKSPWGQGPKNAGPEVPSLNLVAIGLALVALFLVFRSVYQIQPGEQGVVLRFGQFHQTTSSGLNFLIPFVEEVIKVDVESIRKEEFGTRRTSGLGSNALGLESLMLTSDFNVIQVNWVVQYKIRDPEHFLFNIENPRAAVRDSSESVIRRLVGNRDFNYVLNNREELGTATLEEMQGLLDKYNSGIQLVVVQLQDVNPPDPVRPSFNEVNEAEQDKIRLGNEAQKRRNELVPRAEGEAKKMIDEAEGYSIERINKAKGDVARFNAIYKEYRNAKTVTRTRMYLEALKQALPQVQEVIVVDQSSKGMMPLINIGAAATMSKPQAKQQAIDAATAQPGGPLLQPQP